MAELTTQNQPDSSHGLGTDKVFNVDFLDICKLKGYPTLCKNYFLQ